MMSKKGTDTEKLEALIDALADSVRDTSDGEILEELRQTGVDPDAEAVRLRTMMLDTIKSFRQRSLNAAREAYGRQTANLDKTEHLIPATAAERRKLFESFIRQPRYLALVTSQFRNLQEVTDNDIEAYLQDLAELGILEKLSPPDATDGEE